MNQLIIFTVMINEYRKTQLKTDIISSHTSDISKDDLLKINKEGWLEYLHSWMIQLIRTRLFGRWAFTARWSRSLSASESATTSSTTTTSTSAAATIIAVAVKAAFTSFF